MKSSLFTVAFAAVLGFTLAGIPITSHAADITSTTTTTAPAPTPKPKKTAYKGTVTALDATAHTITIQSTTKTTVLTTDDKTVFKKDKLAALPTDVAVGMVITGSYITDASGAMVAASVHMKTTTTAPAKAATAPAKPATPAAQ